MDGLAAYTNDRHQAILDLSLDDPDADLPFSRHLALSNLWTADFTDRAIREYKRFLILTDEAGQAVSPSDAVDQVWHLHLTYTRHYWDHLCREILGWDLHHTPCEGGNGNAEQRAELYRQTLESYCAVFGETPPADIWPAPDQRFTARHARIDISRNQIVPKPEADLSWQRRELREARS
ncbi:MAG: hypothetical protein AAGL24_01480 [Pseudomonadota bacterium]